MMLAKLLPAAVPSSVKPNVAPVIVPALVIRMFPLLATMLLALPSVIRPLHVAAVAELFVNAPPAATPVPLSVRG
jgi:hypothetical protein